MKKKHFICDCHQAGDLLGKKWGCNLECNKCSGAKEVNIKYEKGKKTVTITL